MGKNFFGRGVIFRLIFLYYHLHKISKIFTFYQDSYLGKNYIFKYYESLSCIIFNTNNLLKRLLKKEKKSKLSGVNAICVYDMT